MPLSVMRRSCDGRWPNITDENGGAHENYCGPAAFRLQCRETGEYGLLNVFYDVEELWVPVA